MEKKLEFYKKLDNNIDCVEEINNNFQYVIDTNQEPTKSYIDSKIIIENHNIEISQDFLESSFVENSNKN
jgi:hypothetical protein